MSPLLAALIEGGIEALGKSSVWAIGEVSKGIAYIDWIAHLYNVNRYSKQARETTYPVQHEYHITSRDRFTFARLYLLSATAKPRRKRNSLTDNDGELA